MLTKQQIKVSMLTAGSLAFIKNLDPNKMSNKDVEQTLVIMQEIIKEEQEKLLEEHQQ